MIIFFSTNYNFNIFNLFLRYFATKKKRNRQFENCFFLRLYKPLLHEVVHFSSVIGSIFRTLHNHPTAFELQIKNFKQFYKLFFCQEYGKYIAKPQHIWFIYYHDNFTETERNVVVNMIF